MRSRSTPAAVSALDALQRLLGALARVEPIWLRRDARAPHDGEDGDGDAAPPPPTTTYEAQRPPECRLLPTVHEAWQALVPRLDDERAAVQRGAIVALAALAAHARGFVGARFVREALPSLRRLLDATTRESALVASSVEQKRLLAALHTLAVVVQHCALADSATTSLVAALDVWRARFRGASTSLDDAFTALDAACAAERARRQRTADADALASDALGDDESAA